MALTATVHHIEIALSDVDRNVYESLDLRVAQHPSETMRFLLTRTLAYALSYEEGIAFSKGGLSATDEPPIAVRDPTGILLAWIDVGAPSAERLHKASKAARRVAIFTHASLAQLQKEAATRTIHKVEDIDVWCFETTFLDALEAKTGRNTKLEITRNDGQLYVGVSGATLEAPLARASLAPSAE
ncbi:MAG: YaeQ family protein [Labilithrix sp.]|nr:YaeQ family protein [Labilithrix sp.]